MKSILFNTNMVRAIQADRKTVTRRVVKPPALYAIQEDSDGWCVGSYYEDDHTAYIYPTVDDCPYQPGQVLYVRETWHKDAGRYMYKADYSDSEKFYRNGKEISIKWRPSIHMPREAARIFLRVTDVRVERLWEITEEQAKKEGCKGWKVATSRDWDVNPDYRAEFRYIWNNTIKKADLARYGWDANPWVWVIEFERISREEATR